jgi:hypothetical protein
VSTFALVVIGVGACIGVVTSLLLRPDEPATLSAPPIRAPRQARARRSEPGGVAVGAGTTTLVDVAERDAPALDEEAAWGASAPPALPEPATTEPPPRLASRPAGPPRPLEGEPNTPTPWWQRLLAAAELATIAVVLGVLFAAAIGLAVVGLFGLLRGAVG